MKSNIKKIVSGLLVVVALAVGFGMISSNQTFAADPLTSISDGALEAKTADQAGSLFGTDGIFKKIVDTALFLVGAISVVMLIYGGIRYTVSGGDSTAVGNAKNTILYAIVGVVISLLAYSIVNFVIGRLV